MNKSRIEEEHEKLVLEASALLLERVVEFLKREGARNVTFRDAVYAVEVAAKLSRGSGEERDGRGMEKGNGELPPDVVAAFKKVYGDERKL